MLDGALHDDAHDVVMMGSTAAREVGAWVHAAVQTWTVHWAVAGEPVGP
jgi:hypothetical protein